MDNMEIAHLPPEKEAFLNASVVLDKERHTQVVLNLEEYARDANIDPKWIGMSAKDYLPAKVVPWVVKFREIGKSLIVENKSAQDSMQDMCCAIAGVMIRNFISTRVMTVTKFIGATEAGSETKYSCLLMPSFHSVSTNGTISSWNVGYVVDGIMSRQSAGKHSLLVCDDVLAMYTAYGPAFRKMVEEDFLKVTI